jgi:hypothetical protein
MDPMDPMTPTTQPSEPPAEENTAEAALAQLKAAAPADFDMTQMDALKAKLAKLGKGTAKTASGSEAPAEGTGQPQDGRPLTGRDVDWSEYNLDYNLAHLYPGAVYRETPQGPKWVAMVVDFLSTTREFRAYNEKVNPPGVSDAPDSEKEPKNLGLYLNDMCNGREQWKISAVMPVGTQCGLLLERQVPIILPDPQVLKKAEEVAAPADPALQAVEDAALAFIEEQNGPDVGLRPIERGTAEHEDALAQLDETGGVQARTSGVAVQQALDLAAPLTTAAPQAGLVTPEPVENPLLGGAKVPAAGYSAAQDLLRALSDPNFRSSLPTEE